MALPLRACICLWRLLLVISHPPRRHDKKNEDDPKFTAEEVTPMKTSTCQKRDCSARLKLSVGLLV
jgi:hypothetical protein